MATGYDSSYHWNLEGNDRTRFRAYATLLELQSNGQIQDHQGGVDTGEELDEDVFDDADTTSPDILTSFDDNVLKDSLLDRIAEVASSEKAGSHVAASVLQERKGAVRLIIARNEGFVHRDVVFFREVENIIHKIARECHGSHVQRLSDEITRFQKSRIRFWLKEAQPNLEFIKSREAYVTRSSRVSDTRINDLVTALEVIRILITAYFGSQEQIQMGIILSQISRTIWNSYPPEVFQQIGIPKARKLRDSLGYIGRINASCNTITRAAQRLRGFDTLQIILLYSESTNDLSLLKSLDRRNMDAKSWTLEETCRSLFEGGQCVTNILGRNWRYCDAVKEFGSRMRRDSQFHAETQLLMYLSSEQSQFGWLTHRYIGCSKRSCFLCSQFISKYDTATFRTRGSHGALFSQWTIPQTKTASKNPDASVWLARILREVEEEIVSFVNKDRKGSRLLAGVKQSSVGGSSCETQVPLSDTPHISEFTRMLISDRMDKERAYRGSQSLLDPAEITSNAKAGIGRGQFIPLQQVPEVPEPEMVDTKEGENDLVEYECEGICYRQTSRHCSRCGQGYFCGTVCEEHATVYHLQTCSGRPLRPVDYLERTMARDELPDDPEVEEKFGFDQCSSSMDRAFLLGIYKGLFNVLKVPAATVHSWMEAGTLRENIIKEYETAPVKGRGSYFPWFLQQTQILNKHSGTHDAMLEGHSKALEETRRHLSLEDQGLSFSELSPPAKKDSFFFFSVLSMGEYPNPNLANLWFNFGFCVCPDEYQQRMLGTFYSNLTHGNKIREDWDRALNSHRHDSPPVETCTFAEFWTHFEQGNLVSLIKRYRGDGVFAHRYLETFLSIPPNRQRPRVWHLKHLLELGDGIGNTSVLNCPERDQLWAAREAFGLDLTTSQLDVKDTMILKDFYRRLLFGWGDDIIDPLELEEARVQGRLLEFLQQQQQRLGSRRIGSQASELRRILKKGFGEKLGGPRSEL